MRPFSKSVLALALVLAPFVARATLVTPPTLLSITPPASSVAYGSTVSASGTWLTNFSDNSDGNNYNGVQMEFSWFRIGVTAPDGTTTLTQNAYNPVGSPGVQNSTTYGFTTGALNQVGVWQIYLLAGDGRPWYTYSSTYNVTVSKINQTISFTNPGTKTYGAAPFALSASATSGLGVTFSVASGPATISGSTLTITGAGTVVVNANQGGNATYNAAAQVQQSFTVNPAAQAISWTAAPTSIYAGGALTFTATGSFTGSYGWGVSPGGPTGISGTGNSQTITFGTAGTYTVSVYSNANANYSQSPTITVTVVVDQLPTPSVSYGTSITLGQSVTVTIMANQGSTALTALSSMRWNEHTGTWSTIPGVTYNVTNWPPSYPNDTYGAYNDGTFVNESASGPTYSKTFTWTPYAVLTGTYSGFEAWAWDTSWTGANAVGGPGITVSKATPVIAGWSNLTRVNTGTFPAGFSVTLSNPNSALVVQPSGSPTFSIVSATGGGASPTSGAVNASTTFNPGTYVLACNYAGDANYVPSSWNVTFTVTGNPPVSTFGVSASTIVLGGSVNLTGTSTSSSGILYGDQFYRFNGTTYYQPNGATNTRTWNWMTVDTGWSALSSPTDIPPNGNSDMRTATWTPTSPGSYAVYYAAVDSAGNWSVTQGATVNVVAPPTALVTLGSNPITFGQSTSVVMSVAEAVPGTLTAHWMLWDQGNGSTWTGIGFMRNFQSQAGMTGITDLTGSPTGPNSSTKSFTFTPWAANAAGYQFLSYGQNNMGSTPNWSQVGLVVNKATPGAVFASVSKTPLSGTTYTAVAGDFNATFSNPYSGGVAQPSGAISYTISPLSPNGVSGSAVSPGTTFTAGLTYVIRATVASDGNYNTTTADSTWTISQAGQTITFPAPASQTYGNPPFTLTATASSGLTVVYSILSGPGTVSGNTVTITGAGTIVIQASQPGTVNWSAAATMNQSVTVNPEAQVVTLSPLSPTVLASQSVTFTASGAPNGYNWSGTSGVSGSGPSKVVLFSTPGSYTVVVQSPAGGNYAASAAVSTTVTVQAASTLTVIPDAGGTVTGTGLYATGSSPGLSATANLGYVFAGWYGANVGSLSSAYLANPTINLTGNMTVNARFVSTASAVPMGTVVFPTATFAGAASGSRVTTRVAMATNVGNSQLELRGLSIITNTADFSVPSNGGLIAPTSNIPTTVSFSPSGTTISTRTGTLIIVSTDPSTPVQSWQLSGPAMDGIIPPTVTLSVTSLSLIFPGDSITLNMTASTTYDSIAYFQWYLSTPTGNTGTVTVMGPSLTLTSNVPYGVPNLTTSVGAYVLNVLAVDTNGLSTTASLPFSVVQGLYNQTVNLRAEPTGSLNLWFTTSATATDPVNVWLSRH